MKEKDRKKLIIIAIVLIIVGVAMLFLDVDKIFNDAYENDKRPPANASVVVIDDVEYIPNEGVNFLLMGVDKYGGFVSDDDIGYFNTQCVDFLAILSVNEAKKEYTVFHINRDTMVDYDLLGVGGYKYGTTFGQISLSHTQGNGGSVSAKNTVNAVKNIFETATTLGTVKIDYYITFTMDIISILADDVMDTLSGENNHGITVTLDEGQLLEGIELSHSELNGNRLTLHGSDALSFIRARHDADDSTNIARMRRQRQFMNAFVNELGSFEINELKMLSCLSLLTEGEHLMSDASPQQLYNFVNFITKRDSDGEKLYNYTGIVTPDGKAKRGEPYMEFTTDPEDLKRLMIEVFLQEKDK